MGNKLTSFVGDLSSIENTCAMFYNCTALSSFDSNLSHLTNGSYMFAGCYNLKNLNVHDLSSMQKGCYMFYNCKNQAGKWDIELPNLEHACAMFCNYGIGNIINEFCVELPKLKIANYMFFYQPIREWTTSLATVVNGLEMFKGNQMQTFKTRFDKLEVGTGMFIEQGGLREFDANLPSLVTADNMFPNSILTLESVQKIGEGIRTWTSGSHPITIGIGCTQSTFDDHSTGWYDAIQVIKGKGWTVNVRINLR